MSKEDDVKGGASEEEINQAYKESYDPQDPNTLEKELQKLKEGKKEKRKKEFKKRNTRTPTDTEGNTLTNSPGQVFKGGEQITGTTPPDTDMRTGEMIPNDLDEDEFGNPKLYESIAFESGLNIALDKLTTPLLGAPIPFARVAYGISNAGLSAIINYYAQRIRGTKFSLGELVTASGLSLVPGGVNAKTLQGSIAKAARKGAATGATAVTSESLIDTGDFPDATTFAAGTLFGGVAGGTFQATSDFVEDIPAILKGLRQRADSKNFIPFDSGIFDGVGTVAAAKVNPAGKGNRIDLADLTLRTAKLDPANPYYARIKKAASRIPQYIEQNEGGALVFNYDLFQNSIKGSGEDGRQFLELFQTEMSRIFEGVPTEVGAQGFKNFDIAIMQKTFKPAAELLGLTGRGTVGRMDASNTHHIAALKGIMGIYDNLGFGSPMYKQVNDVFARYTKGLGGQEGNFVRLIGGTSDVGSPHYLAHAFLNDAIGRDGRKFFTDDVLANMNASDSVRLQKADELARIVADSAAVAEQAQNVYKTVAEAANAEDYAEVMKTTARLLDKGLLKMAQIRGKTYSPRVTANIAAGKYVTRNFDNLIEDIALIHKALPSAKPADIDKILFSEQLLKSQKSFQKLVRKIEEKFGDKGVTASEMRKILDTFDVRMQNQGVGQTGLFEDMPDNLLDDVLDKLALKKQKARTKLNQKKYKKDPDIN